MTALRFEPVEKEPPLRVSFVPLIDVVLQIICFYLFVSAGVQAYSDNSILLPTMSSDPLKNEHPAALTINLDADGMLAVNGEAIDADALGSRLVEGQIRAEINGEDFSVAIRADRRQQVALLDSVLQSCREAKVRKVYLRAMAEGTSGGGR